MGPPTFDCSISFHVLFLMLKAHGLTGAAIVLDLCMPYNDVTVYVMLEQLLHIVC